ELVKEFELPNSPAALFHNIAWSPNGRYLATCNSFGTQLLIYDASSWKIAKTWGSDIAGACQKPVFSSDGTELTVWAYNLVTLSVDDWQVLRLLKGDSTYQDGNVVRRRSDGWDTEFRVQDIAYVPASHDLLI